MFTIKNLISLIRIRLLLLAFLLMAIALLTKFYTLPGANFVQGYLGDLLAVVILMLLLKFAWLKLANYIIAFSINTLAVGIEIFQLLNAGWGLIAVNNFLLSVVLGQTFDLLDLFAYFIGAVLGWWLLNNMVVKQ